MFTTKDQNLNYELQDLYSRLLHDQRDNHVQLKVETSDLLTVLKAVMDIQSRLNQAGH